MLMFDGRFQYGDEEHAFYEEHGYYLFNVCLTANALTECRRRVDAMLGRLHPGISPEVIISAHHQETWLFDLATEPVLLDMIERQIGPNVLLWSTHLLCKAPRTGQYVPWHQDAPYWNIRASFGAGVWIPLDDIDEENGAMSVIPGWHRKGTLPIQDSEFVEGFTEEIVPSALPKDFEQVRVPYLMRAGQMAIHHVMIPHNSPPNRSDRWRRVMVFRYVAPDGQLGRNTYANYATGEPFEREYFLVRGTDASGRGWRRSPFEPTKQQISL